MGGFTPVRLFIVAPLGASIFYLHNLTLPCRNMDFTRQVTPGHAKSFSSIILIPKDYPIDQESYTLRIPTRKLMAGIRDDELLAKFSKGFFGGWKFTPERWIAPITQNFIDNEVITASRTSDPNLSTSAIWKLELLSRTAVPPLEATLFGLIHIFFCAR